MKKPPLSQASFKSSTRHGCHAIVKCPNDHCGYVGRSDSVKRHIKRKHPDMNLVPPTGPMVAPPHVSLSNPRLASQKQSKSIRSPKRCSQIVRTKSSHVEQGIKAKAATRSQLNL